MKKIAGKIEDIGKAMKNGASMKYWIFITRWSVYAVIKNASK